MPYCTSFCASYREANQIILGSPCTFILRDIFRAALFLDPFDTIGSSGDVAPSDVLHDDLYGQPALFEGKEIAEASLSLAEASPFIAEDSSETSWGLFAGPEAEHALNLNWASNVLDDSQDPFNLLDYNEPEEPAQVYDAPDPDGFLQPFEDNLRGDSVHAEELLFGGNLWT
jgi:hypothetical protein